jgi:hypothetical protein
VASALSSFRGPLMRSDAGPVRVLTPRAPHAVIAELRMHELSVEEISVPAMAAAPKRVMLVESLPACLLVKRPTRRRPN